jgi:NitT/TauT family transport system permease protein
MADVPALEFEAALPTGVPASGASARVWGVARRLLSFVVILLVLVLLWEGYKLLGAATNNTVPFTSIRLPVRSDDKSMPHIWNMVGALFRPAQRGNADTLLIVLLRAAWFTWQEAALGFIMGSLIGFALGAVFGRSALLERGLMPYVVVSQTVPLLAIAPMIVIWGGRLNFPAWLSVSIISAYLTFFPVTINTLRGLRSPQPAAVELMRSYAASESQILWKLRVPAALPYIFTALRISATASVIGAVVGELPSGIGEGLGRALLTFSYYYVSGPEKLYAAILIAALVGIVFVGLVSGAERALLPAQRRLAE